MKEFRDLQELYEHLEQDALSYKYEHQIGDQFQKLRDEMYKARNEAEQEKTQFEVDFFNFSLQSGELKPQFSGTNEKGEPWEYPTISKFDDRSYTYLEERLGSTANPLLKARYSHLLWISPKKHQKFAKTAIDSYLELSKIYETRDSESPKEHFGLHVLNYTKTAYYLSCNINYKKQNVAKRICELIQKFSYKSSSSFALRSNLIELMLKDKKIFSTKDFKGITKICWGVAQDLAKGNLLGSNQMIELGHKVDEKIGTHTHEWDLKIAKNYEELMHNAEKQQNLASLNFCQQAIAFYKKVENAEKIEELEKKYTQLKDSSRLSEFKTEIDLTELIKKCRVIAQKVTENNPEEIIKVIMLDKTLLPTFEDMKKKAKDNAKKYPLQHLSSTQIFDKYMNVIQVAETGEEKTYIEILREFDFHLRFTYLYLINEIFDAAIRKGKLNCYILLDFFRRYSWFAKNLSRPIGSNKKPFTYNWLQLLWPALGDYFMQISHHQADPLYSPNFVLCIDSLTVKIEGLIRDMCYFAGVPTFYQTNDNKGRLITKEKDIHALLYDDKVKTWFDEDDILFFKFLLVEKAGYNLRHKVAHALLYSQEYSISYMNLLIMALLKLGKYDFVKKNSNNT